MSLLSTDALNLERHQIGVEFAGRRDAFGRELVRVRSQFTARGALHSSMYVHAVRELIKQEYQVRAEMAWATVSRVIEAEGVRASSELGAQAKSEIRFALESCADLKKADEDAQAMLRGGNWSDHYDLKHLAISRAESEIDLVMFASERASEREPSQNITIINPVGIVQTGAGASATMTQTVTPSDRALVEQALASVRSILETTTEVSPVFRDQALEVVGDAEHEVKSDRPNLLRLRGAVSAVGSTIRTLGSARAAYDLLRAAAAVLGIHLP